MQTYDAAQRELESLLEFYLASGLDCFLDDDAVDRFALAAELASRPRSAPQGHPGTALRAPAAADPGRAPRPMPPMPGGPASQAPTAPPAVTMPIPGGSFADAVVPDREAILSAQTAARDAKSLEELKQVLTTFNGCNLRRTAKNLVFADGNPNAGVMLVGDAPGRDDDRHGRPFTGPSGQFLDKILAAIGLDRSSVYMANVVPWRPPGDRTPTLHETEICKPFIIRQIELVAPDILIFLGAASVKSLLDVKDGIRQMRGRWMTYRAGGRDIACLATYDPVYLLRNPIEKRLCWQDFLALQAKLEQKPQG